MSTLNVIDGDTLLAIEGLGKPYKFLRFKCDDSLSKWWSNCGRYPDALKWVPNKNIKVSGFSVFAASETTNTCYDMQYEVRVNDQIIIQKTPVFKSPPFEDTYFV